MENVVFYIKIYAFYKNDFYLGSFFTNAGGQCVITKNMFKIISDAVIETGIMDYRSIEEASALAEIQILKSEEIIKVIQDGGRAPKWQAKRL